jgi:hypothetical protein
MEVGDFILVKWLDTVTDNDWNTEEQALRLEPREIKTSGWLVKKTKNKIILTAMTGVHHTLLACIPMRSVVSIKKVKE